jgi:hypothetical protein
MELSSPSFANNQAIPTKFTCQGKNISPELLIKNIPAQTQTLALILDDPDATHGTWNHWLIWNISANTQQIPENVGAIFATQGITSFKKPGYGGPCPPSGSHRYIFTLYALNQKLTLPPTANKENLLEAMNNAIIEQTTLTGLYQKS